MARISDPRFWVPVAISFFVTLGAVLVGAASTGAGTGNFLPIMLMFPFAMLISGVFELGSIYLIVLAVVQFPIYGVVLGQGSAKGHFIATALLLIFIHGSAVALVLAFAERGSWTMPAFG